MILNQHDLDGRAKTRPTKTPTVYLGEVKRNLKENKLRSKK